MSNNVQIKLFEPTDPQRDMLEVINNDKPFTSLFAYGRQVGKTFAAERDATLKGMNGEKANGTVGKTKIFWISPTADQASKSLESIISMFDGREDLFKQIFKKVNRKYPELTFQNGSFIKFRSAEQGDSLRGGTMDFIYIDEAAFVDKGFIESVLNPMLMRTQGRFIWTSTFNGRNWFWDMYEEGRKEENQGRVKSLLRTFWDLNDPQVEDYVINKMKPSMSASRFNQEYLCIPVSADAVFSNISLQALKEISIDETKEHFMGIDVGLVNDDTVMSIQDQDGNFVDIERFNYRAENMTHEDYKARVWRFVEKHANYTVAGHFEINGKELLFDQLCDNQEFRRIFDPFVVSFSTKPKMIEAMIIGFEKKEITYPEDVETERQLFDFRGKQNANGVWQFGNESKDGHDDIVMSMAHANYCRVQWYDGGIVEVW